MSNGFRQARMIRYDRWIRNKNLKSLPYQRKAVEWALERELRNTTDKKGGIIADEMGMGKTYTMLGAIMANPNCFVFNEMFPGGFTPSFGGDVTDWSIASGVSGTTDGGTDYDISVNVGDNRSDFYIENTVNPSLGPQSPTQFNPGSYIQLEKNFNMDFVAYYN